MVKSRNDFTQKHRTLNQTLKAALKMWVLSKFLQLQMSLGREIQRKGGQFLVIGGFVSTEKEFDLNPVEVVMERSDVGQQQSSGCTWVY